jgi:hypothetical protein
MLLPMRPLRFIRRQVQKAFAQAGTKRAYPPIDKTGETPIFVAIHLLSKPAKLPANHRRNRRNCPHIPGMKKSATDSWQAFTKAEELGAQERARAFGRGGGRARARPVIPSDVGSMLKVSEKNCTAASYGSPGAGWGLREALTAASEALSPRSATRSQPLLSGRLLALCFIT